MLILAREFCGETQRELADGLSLSQAEVSKFETGIKIPSEEQIRRIASHVHFQEDLFYQWEAVQGFGSGCVYHRKRKTASEIQLRRLLAMMNIRRIQVAQLLRAASVRAENRFEHFDIDEHESPMRVAQKVRHLWNLPPGPLQNLTRAIEDAGGIIVSAEFGVEKIDAISQWTVGLPPVFLVNSAIPADRLRFTLAHELGHIFMHRVLTDDMEKEADKFAAEFLMPEKDIRSDLTNLTLPRLATLKQYWRVSMAALLYRAAEIGTISPRTKQYLWFQMGKNHFRTHEPVVIPREEPTLLRKLFDAHVQELGYTVGQFSKMLFVPSDDELIRRHMSTHGNYRGFALVK